MASTDEINQAIRDCVVKSAQSNRPLNALAEALGELSTIRFSPAEVSTITQACLRMLGRLLEPPSLEMAIEQDQPPAQSADDSAE